MPLEDQKLQTERYRIIPRVLIFSIREENLLLIKGSPSKKIWANLYNGIGGHIEKGENIITAAKREFFEETGLELLNPQLRAVITIDTNQSTGIGLFVFTGQAGEGAPLSSSEGLLEWVNPDRLSDLPLVEDLETLIPIILEKTSGVQIHFGQYKYSDNGELVIQFEEIN